MDSKTVFVRTGKGDDLAGDLKRTLLMVDGTATFAEISKRAAPSLRSILESVLKELESGGYIQDKAKIGSSTSPKMIVPLKKPTPPPAKNAANEDDEELDFTAAPKASPATASKPPDTGLNDEATNLRNKLAAARSKTATDAHARQTAETLAKAEAERVAAQKAEQQARIEAENIEKARAIAEERARVEKAAQAKVEAERIAKEQTAKENKARAEAELIAKERANKEAKVAAEAKAEAERIAREKAAAEAKAEAERIAKEKAAAEAKAEAERIAKEKAAAEAKAEAERIAREKAAAEAKAEAERIAKEKAAAEAKAEAERIAREKAAAEAKARAEREAQIKAEAERLAQQQAAAARAQAELEVAKARAELEAAKMTAEMEAQARAEAERRAEETTAAANAQAELEIAQARAELEAAKAAEATKSRTQGMPAFDQTTFETNKQRSTILPGRASSATVLFFDIVGYTKQSVNKQIELKKQFNHLVSACLEQLGDGERIILDTGDGAAIGFMQHPDDALTVAMAFRQAVTTNDHQDYPALQVRIGIHLGPINVVTDMNGHNNMVGDGINDAQRIMSFAGMDQIYISRPYHDFISRLNDEYAALFQYRGLQNDKHGREHQVYELVDAATPQTDESSSAGISSTGEFTTFEFDKFTLAAPGVAKVPEPVDTKPQEQIDPLPVIEPIVPDEPAEAEAATEISEAATPSVTQHTPLPSEKKSKKEKPKPAAKSTQEDEEKQLAAAQAKAWTEAEQRAVETARINAEKMAQQTTQPRPAAEAKVQRARKPRQPIPWGKISTGIVVLAVIVLFVAPYLVPTKGYISAIEQQLSRQIQQPVRIGSVSGQLLPVPRIELHDVSIGSGQQIKLQQAQANFSLLGLFSPVKTIDSVDLQGLQVSGAALQQIIAWLQQVAADNEFPIKRMVLNKATLDTDVIQLGEIKGEISFKSGKFSQAQLTANAEKYQLDIDASNGSKALVNITVRDSALPLLPTWTFDDFNAKGEINKDELIITDIDSRIYGGILIGDARLAWSSGWSLQGTLVAKTITMQNMIPSLSGDMNGTARYKMQAVSLSKLTDEATVAGNFSIKKGIISGMDMVETVRLRNTEVTPGGRTHFDELNGDWSYANNVYHFKQLKLSAGILNAGGSMDMSKQKLSGKASANLTVTGQGAVSLQIDGTNTNPTLRASR